MINFTVVSLEIPEDNNKTYMVARFNAFTLRPTDQRTVRGGSFIAFIPNEYADEFEPGNEFALSRIVPEEETTIETPANTEPDSGPVSQLEDDQPEDEQSSEEEPTLDEIQFELMENANG